MINLERLVRLSSSFCLVLRQSRGVVGPPNPAVTFRFSSGLLLNDRLLRTYVRRPRTCRNLAHTIAKPPSSRNTELVSGACTEKPVGPLNDTAQFAPRGLPSLRQN